MADQFLTDARVLKTRGQFFESYIGWNDASFGLSRVMTWSGGIVESQQNVVTFDGLYNPSDGIQADRLTAAAGSPTDRTAWHVLPQDTIPVFNRLPSSPLGFYFRALAIIEDTNRASILEAHVGFTRGGNVGAVDFRSPKICFIVEGTSNWKARVEDTSLSSPQTDDVDTGIAPTAIHLLEIVIRPGSTRFYIDETLVHASAILYPPDDPDFDQAVDAQPQGFMRWPGIVLEHTNSGGTIAMRFGLRRTHAFVLT